MTKMSWKNKKSTWSLSEDNLRVLSDNKAIGGASTGEAITKGKWYWEVEAINNNTLGIGICKISTDVENIAWNKANNFVTYIENGNKSIGGSNGFSAYGSGFNNGDIIGVAIDTILGTVEFFKNGASQGIAFDNILSLGDICPLVMRSASVSMPMECKANFGATHLKYDIPKGYLPLDLESAKENWFKRLYNLIKSNNKIYSLSDTGEWIDIASTKPLTKLDFEKYGITDTSIISDKQWSELDDFEILTWTDSKKYEVRNEAIKLELDSKYAGHGKLFRGELEDIVKVSSIEAR